jgi:tetratricopeptide (TPR) repeat protein
MKKFTIILGLFFTLSLGLKSQNVDCFILRAPEKPFYELKKIGILEIECKTNRNLNKTVTDFITADLLDQRRGIYAVSGGFYGLGKTSAGKTYVKGVNTDFYQVIERAQLEKVLKEQRLSLSGALDENSAAEVGRLLGLDIIIMGNVSYSSTDKRSGTDYPCLERTVTAKGTMKMVSVLTAQIVGTKSAEAVVQIKKCTDSRSEIPDKHVMAESAMKQLARKFTNYFTPGYQHITYKFERIKLKEFKTKGKEAFQYVKNGDLDRAFPIIYAMFEADSYNPKTANNLAILYEMVGSNSDALEYYNIAYEIDPSDKDYLNSVNRAKAGVGLNKYLEYIGRPVIPYTFTGDGIETALLEKVEVKGSSSDRVNVYELPDKKSDVAAKVPGGLNFTVIEESGEFYKIQLRGTKTGFIMKSDVK